VEILPLSPDLKETFALCLEDWSADARASGPHRAAWVERTLPLGLGARIARDDDGAVAGMIQYLPIEHTFIDGEGLYFIPCTWVHGHEGGQGDRRGHGIGSALLEEAEADARASGALGMVAWGLWIPVWMRSSWYRKHGYRNAARQGLSMLVWKPFFTEARAPRWMALRPKPLALVAGKVTVTAFVNGWCMAQNLAVERARRAAFELGDRVVFCEIPTFERDALMEWGRSDALYVDEKEVRNGPPPTYEKIRDLIAKRVGRL
jgi:predicted N-acetyltransferase YhbS